MNWNIIRLVTGIALLFIGVKQVAYDQSSYVFGGGLIIWGTGSILLAWASKNGGQSVNRAANILYLVGCLLTIAGLFLRN